MKIKVSKKEWIVFIGFGLILFIIPYVFTRKWGVLPIENVGDTIGGITAPFLGFFGSILVYLALKSQVDANEQVRLQFEKQEQSSTVSYRLSNLYEKIKIIREELNNFYYSYLNHNYPGSPKKFNYQGVQAIHNLLDQSRENYFGKIIKSPYELEPKLGELKSLIIFFLSTVEEINTDKVIDEKDKKELINNMNYLFDSKIKTCFNPMEKYKSKHNNPCPENCGNFHGIPSDLFDFIQKIETLFKKH